MKKKKLTPTQLSFVKVINRLKRETTEEYKALTPANLADKAQPLNDKINLLKVIELDNGGSEAEIATDMLAQFGAEDNGFKLSLQKSPNLQMKELKAYLTKQGSDARENLYKVFGEQADYVKSEEGQAYFKEMYETFSKFANQALRSGGGSKPQRDNASNFAQAY